MEPVERPKSIGLSSRRVTSRCSQFSHLALTVLISRYISDKSAAIVSFSVALVTRS